MKPSRVSGVQQHMPRVTELQVNDRAMAVNAEAERSLLSVLRDDLDLTGSKYGCGEAQCGACTVLIDGVPTRSCVLKVGDAAQKRVTTIEALERNGELHPVQQAFLDEDALQCGYCTSGMIMAAYALLEKNRTPSDEEIVRAMNGHICRCGVYQRIIAAVRSASAKMNNGSPR